MKKQETGIFPPIEVWITSKEAASILTANSKHTVSIRYVRLLAENGHIQTKQIDERTKLYLKADVENRTVAQRKKSA